MCRLCAAEGGTGDAQQPSGGRRRVPTEGNGRKQARRRDCKRARNKNKRRWWS